MDFEDYPIEVSPLPTEEGGGYLVTFPDLPGCIADGSTVEAAVSEARDAFAAWAMAETADQGRLPEPKTFSGQFVQRIPKSLHMRLAKRAATEGVSLNQLAATLLAQGLAAPDSAAESADNLPWLIASCLVDQVLANQRSRCLRGNRESVEPVRGKFDFIQSAYAKRCRGCR